VPGSQVVHVVDDDLDVRQSLAFLLGAAGHTVRVYDSALALLAALPDIHAGCIVTDIRMPGMDGLELQRRLKSLKVALPVVVITGHGDIPLAVEAMKAGAVDFIEKPFADDTLLNAINFALARHEQHARRGLMLADVHECLNALTEREAQVLDGLVDGKPNKIIAHELGISVRTVEVYRANVMTKMKADSLSGLVRMVLLARQAE
jgi:two-component system response regulator FixJ